MSLGEGEEVLTTDTETDRKLKGGTDMSVAPARRPRRLSRFPRCLRASVVNGSLCYGPTPPLWQSLQLTAVRSPISTGCLNDCSCICARCDAPSSWSSSVWHELQFLLMTLPSLLTWLPSWQRKHPG